MICNILNRNYFSNYKILNVFIAYRVYDFYVHHRFFPSLLGAYTLPPQILNKYLIPKKLNDAEIKKDIPMRTTELYYKSINTYDVSSRNIIFFPKDFKGARIIVSYILLQLQEKYSAFCLIANLIRESYV